MSAKTAPETIPVETDGKGKKPGKKRGADPIDAIPYPEVRAFAYIERAFEDLDDAARCRIAGLVADKYGPKPIILRGLPLADVPGTQSGSGQATE